jgi:pilus assembly protein CpaC
MRRIFEIVRILGLSVCLWIAALPVLAADNVVTVAVNQSQLLTFSGISRVAIANPDIADVVIVSGYEVLVVGKQPGITTLQIWSNSGQKSYKVEVGSDNAQIAAEIKSVLGMPDIRVSLVNKSIILEGKVNDQAQKDRAEKYAAAYADKVIDLLKIRNPMQIKLEAQIIEINRTKTNNLGIAWSNASGNAGNFVFGQGIVNASAGSTVLGKMGSYSDVLGALDALVINGSAKILSQPNVITMSGDKASIMVGGQIPVPVSVQNGTISVDWKDYGIKLTIEPVVNDDGLVETHIIAEVSAIDWTNSHQIGIGAGLKIPPITMRKSETSIALVSGQTMAIGGLLSRETDETITKVPFLADIPILGQLFTDRQYTKGLTELVILVTPTIINMEDYIPDSAKKLQEEIKESPVTDKQVINKASTAGGK